MPPRGSAFAAREKVPGHKIPTENPQIAQPTLLVWGRNDTATPLSDGKKMEQSIPDAGLVVLEGGHYSFLESPAIFENVMRSYFKL